MGILAHAARAHVSNGIADAPLSPVAVVCLRGVVGSPFHLAVLPDVPSLRGAGATVGVAVAILPARLPVGRREAAVEVGKLFCGPVVRVGVRLGMGFGVVGAVE